MIDHLAIRLSRAASAYTFLLVLLFIGILCYDNEGEYYHLWLIERVDLHCRTHNIFWRLHLGAEHRRERDTAMNM